jgi:hypothetical protein
MNPLNYMRLHDTLGGNLRQYCPNASNGKIRILKGRSKMHPLVSLVAIFGGMEMFGILGIFLGPILAAVLIALLQIWPEVGQRFGLLPGSTGETQRCP